LGGEPEREAGSLLNVVAREIAVVLMRDAAGDGQPEAVTGLAGVQPDEAFEDSFALVLGYPGTVVCHAGLDVSIEPSKLHVDLATGSDGGEGVVDEIADDAYECVRVAVDHRVVPGVEGDRDAWCAGRRVGNERSRDRCELDRCAYGPRLEPCEPEEIVDEAAESFAVAGDRGLEAVALGPLGLFAQQRLDARLERGDRRAELVRGVREEAAGRRIARTCILDCGLERADHLVERGSEAAELGVGTARLEPELVVAAGDARCGLDDGGERAKGGTCGSEDEQRADR